MLSKEELEKRKIISLNEFSTKAFCSDKPPYIYFYEKGFDACTEILWPEIERLRKAYEYIDIYSHNARILKTPELVQVKKLTEKVADLEKENERLKLYQYTIECEAQHNKNLHEEELFNSDNLLKRLNEKKAKVADLEKENERLKEAIGYLVKVPTQSYEKELARKLTDLERKLAVCKEALMAVRNSRYSPEPSGGYSQIDVLVFDALKEIEGEK
ncbi:MAG: hypothetical protein IM559_15710 [Pseudanabaena sp. M151S2SP2A07QC]|nr:hypothetical protein [Pseudanabaena sp. M151S2SP2A07QC]